MESENGIGNKGRLRSPNYPALTLQKSLELVKMLLDVHGRRSVPLGVAAQDWGIPAASSYTARHLAALVAYGLVETEGIKDGRKLKVSDLAYNIFIDDRPESKDRAALMKEAALKPEIFRKLYDVYPEKLPADHALDYELKKDHKFNPNSVHDFIGILKATFDFAKVYEHDISEAEIIPAEEKKMIAASDKIPVKETAPIGKAGFVLVAGDREIANYPVLPGLKARILMSGKTPVTGKAIEKLIALLGLNKEDLAESDCGEDQPSQH